MLWFPPAASIRSPTRTILPNADFPPASGRPFFHAAMIFSAVFGPIPGQLCSSSADRSGSWHSTLASESPCVPTKESNCFFEMHERTRWSSSLGTAGTDTAPSNACPAPCSPAAARRPASHTSVFFCAICHATSFKCSSVIFISSPPYFRASTSSRRNTSRSNSPHVKYA